MHNSIIVRYGEIALKGGNRSEFEKQLVKNIKHCLTESHVKFTQVYRKRGRIYINTEEECDNLAYVFGITSFSYAMKQKFNIDEIKMMLVKMLMGKKFKTFRISAHRVDKVIKHNSQELNNELGQFVVEHFDKAVSLKEFDVEIGLEIYGLDSFLYLGRTRGPGGLPYGINGKALAFMDDDDSLLAAWFIMRRGVIVIPIGYNDMDLAILDKYNYGYKPLKVKKIKQNDIDRIAKLMKINSVITNHRADNYEKITENLQLSPLVGMTEGTIQKELGKI